MEMGTSVQPNGPKGLEKTLKLDFVLTYFFSPVFWDTVVLLQLNDLITNE